MGECDVLQRTLHCEQSHCLVSQLLAIASTPAGMAQEGSIRKASLEGDFAVEIGPEK